MSLQSMNQIRETLQSMENVQLAAKFEPSSDTSLDASLLQRYKDSRNQYLQRQMQLAFLEYASTFDGQTFQMPATLDAAQQDASKQREETVRAEVLALSNKVQTNLTALQTKYANFLQNREEFEALLEEMESAGRSMNVDDDDDENLADVDDDYLRQQEAKMLALQTRKAALQQELSQVKQETDKIQKNQTTDTVVLTPDQVAAVKAENEQARVQLSLQQEIQVFYTSLSEFVEVLGGVKVVGVQEAPAEAEEDLQLTMQLLNTHEIQIGLEGVGDSESRNPKNYRVASAKFLTSTLVEASVDNGSPVQMHIPDLRDLVRLSESQVPGQDLRFVLRETLARICIFQARVVELSKLHEEALTKIGKSYHSNVGFGGEDQEVVCSLNEQIAVVLRLTPDCPMQAGSVYIDQLVGLGGWDAKTVQQIQEQVNSQQFASPVALVQAVKAEIQRLEDAGVKIPTTPTLPGSRLE